MGHSYWITAAVAEGVHGEELTEHFQEEAKDELGAVAPDTVHAR